MTATPLRALGRRVPDAAVDLLTLEVLGAPVFAVTVAGVPAPQGSKTAGINPRNGRVFMRESSAKVAPWRATVAAAALDVLPVDWEPLDGPVVADFVFSMPAPASLPKTLRRLPTSMPDLSKLARSTEDALGTDTRVLKDDARIVAYRRLAKVYERDALDTDSLRHPGVVIRLWTVPPALLGRLAP